MKQQYKILIQIRTRSGKVWNIYHEDGKEYATETLGELREKVLSLVDEYGDNHVRVIKQLCGDDWGNNKEYIYGFNSIGPDTFTIEELTQALIDTGFMEVA